ncbi:hypothetical protein F4678DRAFT_429946 [Xylaria arbuscula]|nr:hypothetical protein F4678DRAFT_429946 [Xylaria arbuscula]
MIKGTLLEVDIRCNRRNVRKRITIVHVHVIDEQKSNFGKTTQADMGSHTAAQAEAVKDQVDGAISSGPKRATPESRGCVQVGETGDLHDLAARRRS